jgi:hypothetical protein
VARDFLAASGTPADPAAAFTLRVCAAVLRARLRATEPPAAGRLAALVAAADPWIWLARG